MADRVFPFANMHSDYPLALLRARRGGRAGTLARDYLPLHRRTGTVAEIMTVATDSRIPVGGGILDLEDPRTVLEMIDAVHEEIAVADGAYLLVRDAADLDRAAAEGRIAILLNLEGAGCVKDDFALWRSYHRLGVRALSLTHDPQNRMASGCREPDGGLTRLGRRFVTSLNETRVILDLVHAGERTFHDALDCYEGPVIVSHSNARALCDTPRNLTDAQILAVGARGGFVAPMFCAEFLVAGGRRATMDDVVRHVDHIAGLIGIDKVAIGPDYVDYARDILDGLLHGMGIDPDTVRWAESGETLASIQELAEALARNGYSDEQIEGIMAGNALRVLRALLA